MKIARMLLLLGVILGVTRISNAIVGDEQMATFRQRGIQFYSLTVDMLPPGEKLLQVESDSDTKMLFDPERFRILVETLTNPEQSKLPDGNLVLWRLSQSPIVLSGFQVTAVNFPVLGGYAIKWSKPDLDLISKEPKDRREYLEMRIMAHEVISIMLREQGQDPSTHMDRDFEITDRLLEMGGASTGGGNAIAESQNTHSVTKEASAIIDRALAEAIACVQADVGCPNLKDKRAVDQVYGRVMTHAHKVVGSLKSTSSERRSARRLAEKASVFLTKSILNQ